MAVKFTSSEITQHKVTFKKNKSDLTITLTRHSSTWYVKIIDGPDLTVSELIDICDSFYSENVIDHNDPIEIICNNSGDIVYISDRVNVSKAIMEKVKVTLPQKDKE